MKNNTEKPRRPVCPCDSVWVGVFAFVFGID
jgi:hypothetical protein